MGKWTFYLTLVGSIISGWMLYKLTARVDAIEDAGKKAGLIP